MALLILNIIGGLWRIMGIISFILFTTLATLFGISIVYSFGSRDKYELSGGGILLGHFFATILLFLIYQITNSFNIWTVILVLCSVSITFLIKNSELVLNTVKKLKNILDFKLRDSHKVLLLFITFYFVLSALFNYVWPINDWDAIALYDFRAKLILEGNWNSGIKLGYFFHYPPFTSLLHGIAYLLNFESAKLFYNVLFLGFALTFFSLLKKRVSTIKALFGVFLLTIAPLSSGHILVAYTNLPYSIFFTLGILYTWEWLANKNKTSIAFAFLYFSSSLWIRQAEPFWIIPILLICFDQYKSKNWSNLKYILFGILIFIGFYSYWPVYVTSLQLPPATNTSINDGVVHEVAQINYKTISDNLFLVISHLFTYILKPLITLIVPVIFITLYDKKLKKNSIFHTQLITFGLFLTIVAGGTFIFSFTYATWNQIGGSLTRMIMFFEPLLIFMLMQSSLWFFDKKSFDKGSNQRLNNRE